MLKLFELLGFLQLLFPWARNFTPIASATQLLNREHVLCIVWSGHSWKAALVADVVIPVETTKKIVDHLEFD